MRMLAWITLAIGAILIAAPVGAQTYDPNYPVCLQVYTIDGSHIECRYSTLAECEASAVGRGGTQCMTNPYFAQAGRKRPQQRVY